MQRRLSLASVHGDAAGRQALAAFADREADQARELLDELATLRTITASEINFTGGAVVD